MKCVLTGKKQSALKRPDQEAEGVEAMEIR